VRSSPFGVVDWHSRLSRIGTCLNIGHFTCLACLDRWPNWLVRRLSKGGGTSIAAEVGDGVGFGEINLFGRWNLICSLCVLARWQQNRTPWADESGTGRRPRAGTPAPHCAPRFKISVPGSLFCEDFCFAARSIRKNLRRNRQSDEIVPVPLRPREKV
jgi:hypothetical protein